MPATAEAAKVEKIAKQFGLEAVPESVTRLSQLITNRDANIEDFAKLLARDAALAALVLRVANPRATNEADYTATTVEEALQRTGMTSALLLAMSDPLSRAVQKSFSTMLNMELRVL